MSDFVTEFCTPGCVRLEFSPLQSTSWGPWATIIFQNVFLLNFSFPILGKIGIETYYWAIIYHRYSCHQNPFSGIAPNVHYWCWVGAYICCVVLKSISSFIKFLRFHFQWVCSTIREWKSTRIITTSIRTVSGHLVSINILCVTWLGGATYSKNQPVCSRSTKQIHIFSGPIFRFWKMNWQFTNTEFRDSTTQVFWMIQKSFPSSEVPINISFEFGCDVDNQRVRLCKPWRLVSVFVFTN